MKRILLILITTAMIITMAACEKDINENESSDIESKENNQSSQIAEGSTPTDDSSQPPQDESSDVSNDESAPETQNSEDNEEPNGGVSSGGTSSGGGSNSVGSLVYRTFEEALQSAEVIAVATFNGERPFDEYIEYNFTVKETLFGKTEEKINVYSYDTNSNRDGKSQIVTGDKEQSEFKKDVDYLLALGKLQTLYSIAIFYSPTSDMVIPLNDIKSSKMYNEPIEKHMKEVDFSAIKTADEMISYVKDITKDNIPADYIEFATAEETIKQAPNIVKVSIRELDTKNRSAFIANDIFVCTIKSVIKGNLKKEIKIKILFLPDTVKTGEEWIVALDADDGSSYFQLISKCSLFSKSEESTVKDLINK